MGYIANKSVWIIKKTGTYLGTEYLATGKLVWNGGTAGTAADWDYVAPAPLAIPNGYVERGMLESGVQNAIVQDHPDGVYDFAIVDDNDRVGLGILLGSGKFSAPAGIDKFEEYVESWLTSNGLTAFNEYFLEDQEYDFFIGNKRVILAIANESDVVGFALFSDGTMFPTETFDTIDYYISGDKIIYAIIDESNTIGFALLESGSVFPSNVDSEVIDLLTARVDSVEANAVILLDEEWKLSTGGDVLFAIVDESNRVGLALLSDGRLVPTDGDGTLTTRVGDLEASTSSLDGRVTAIEENPNLNLPVEYSFDSMRRVLPVNGIDMIYASGDSLTEGTWPDTVASSLGLPLVNSAIGGSRSTSQKDRTIGIELKYPLKGTDTITAGTVNVRWERHQADRTTVSNSRLEDIAFTDNYRSSWGRYSIKVTTPEVVEVFNNGKLIGFAKQNLADVTTDYGVNPRKIYFPSNPLSNGDLVAFWIKNDPARPKRYETGGSIYQSPSKPSALYEWRCYFVTASAADGFEICEYASQVAGGVGMDLGSNAASTMTCEYGWGYEWNYDGSDWNLEYKVRSDISNALFLLQIATNDIGNPASHFYSVTQDNIWSNIEAIESRNKRVVVASIGVNHGGHHDGPTGDPYYFVYDHYNPYCEKAFGSLFVNWHPVLNSLRTAKELSFLSDPTVPEKLWIRGTPTNEASWEAFSTDQGDTFLMWVGPGFYPLQFRASFSDTVHLNAGGSNVIRDEVLNLITSKNWY